MLSLSQTPAESNRLQENIDIENQLNVRDIKRRESLKILKESRLRTTKADKLMALLKPIDEIKREL